MHARMRILQGLVLAVVSLACSGSQQGGERQPCYPNGTCNSGLTCLSMVCVQASAGGGGGATGGGSTSSGGGTATGGSGGTGGGTATGGGSAMGGGPAWTPANLSSGVVLWLDSSVGVQLGGGGTPRWQDRSDAGNDGVQYALNALPTTGTRGNRPVVVFNGGILYFVDNPTLDWGTGDVTIAIVGGSPADGGMGGGPLISRESATGSSGWELNTSLSPNPNVLTAGFVQSSVYSTFQSTVPSVNDGQLHDFVFRRVGGAAELRVDGTSTPIDFAYDLTGSNSFRLTLGWGSFQRQSMMGDIAEVVVVQGTLGTSDLSSLESYFRSRYALP
jgi:hypothetical protein